MSEKLKIVRGQGKPIYRQLVDAIAGQVETGSLAPGEKLPTEKDLARSLRVARGTVTRAYEELARAGVLEVVQGRGSFVSRRASAQATGRKEKAEAMVSQLVESLSSLRFSFREMKALFDLAILEREEKLGSLAIAAVDCNPETLGIFERQIGFLARARVSKFLLGDLSRDPDPARRLKDFDLVLTTSTHHADVIALAPSLEDRIARVAVAPSQETLVSLASVRPGQPIGVLCQSGQFLAIIENKLRELRTAGSVTHLFSPLQPGWLAQFLADRRVLIVPPAYRAGSTPEDARALRQFTESGGLVIPFDYQIEKGSLVYVEERIGELLAARADEGEQ